MNILIKIFRLLIIKLFEELFFLKVCNINRSGLTRIASALNFFKILVNSLYELSLTILILFDIFFNFNFLETINIGSSENNSSKDFDFEILNLGKILPLFLSNVEPNPGPSSGLIDFIVLEPLL